MHFMFSEYAAILFRLKIRTAKPTRFQFKNKLSTVNVNGDGEIDLPEFDGG